MYMHILSNSWWSHFDIYIHVFFCTQVNSDNSSYEATVILSGTAEAIKKAQELIEEIINPGSNLSGSFNSKIPVSFRSESCDWCDLRMNFKYMNVNLKDS